MIAFKTFALCPVEQKPVDIPELWPWEEATISEDDADQYESDGFTVMSDSDYLDYKAFHQADFDAWLALQPVPLSSVSPRQIRLALVLSGITLAQISDALATLEEPTRTLAIIQWEYSVEFDRYNGLVDQVGTMLGWTTQQLNDLWIFAATL